MKTLLKSVLLAAVLLVALPGLALADGPTGSKIVFGGTFTLTRGETLAGDLVVMGGSATLEETSRVTGNVALMGGSIAIDGQVDGDAVAIGGAMNLGPNSVVLGNVATFGALLNRSDGSQVRGQVNSGGGLQVPFTLPLPLGTPNTWVPLILPRVVFSPLLGALWVLLRSLALAALAVLVVIFWAKPAERVAGAAISQPAVSGVLGLLTGVVAPGLLLLIAITICLIPVSLIGAVALVAAVAFGWVALGLEVGQRVGVAFKWTLHPAAAAGLGTFLMTLVLEMVGLIPCVGWIAPAVVAAIGLGAVVTTRFGARSYGEPPVAAVRPA